MTSLSQPAASLAGEFDLDLTNFSRVGNFTSAIREVDALMKVEEALTELLQHGKRTFPTL